MVPLKSSESTTAAPSNSVNCCRRNAASSEVTLAFFASNRCHRMRWTVARAYFGIRHLGKHRQHRVPIPGTGILPEKSFGRIAAIDHRDVAILGHIEKAEFAFTGKPSGKISCPIHLSAVHYLSSDQLKPMFENTNQEEALDQQKPEWIRIPEAIRIFGNSRTKLYMLIKEGEFTSVSLRERFQNRGTRLIDCEKRASTTTSTGVSTL